MAQSLFQGMLALVEQARHSRTISADQAAALVRSATAVQVDSEARYLAGVASWIEEEFLRVSGMVAPLEGSGTRVENAVLDIPLADLRCSLRNPQSCIQMLELVYRVETPGYCGRTREIRTEQRALP